MAGSPPLFVPPVPQDFPARRISQEVLQRELRISPTRNGVFARLSHVRHLVTLSDGSMLYLQPSRRSLSVRWNLNARRTSIVQPLGKRITGETYMDRSIHFDAAWSPDSSDGHEQVIITAAILSSGACRLSGTLEADWLVSTCAMSDGKLYIIYHRPSRWAAAEPSASGLARRIRRHWSHHSEHREQPWRRAS